MGQKEVNLPTSPAGWATHLSRLVKIFQEAHGLDRFPIKVATLAQEYSRQVFPDEPITAVKGAPLSEGLEGMLMPSPNGDGEWGIFYNNSEDIPAGRINFTLAHELGHYLLHRKDLPDGIECSSRDMAIWSSEHRVREAEANTFASHLLMPFDDFRLQTNGQVMSLDLINHLAHRYEVSRTAAILKWLSITDKRSMIVVAKSGFIDWAWSSTPLYKSGVFYRARQETIPLPERSAASRAITHFDYEAVTKHGQNVWPGDQDVTEHLIVSPRNEMTISLLIYPNYAPDRDCGGGSGWEDEVVLDAVDHFRSLDRRS